MKQNVEEEEEDEEEEEKEEEEEEEKMRQFAGIALSVIGASGCGKTAAMAKLAAEIYEEQQSHKDPVIRSRPVVIRFCGTSPGSCSGRSLMRSISAQIRLVLGISFQPVSEHAPYTEIVANFHALLRDHPVVVLMDSLDQLCNNDLARSSLTFLSGRHEDTTFSI